MAKKNSELVGKSIDIFVVPHAEKRWWIVPKGVAREAQMIPPKGGLENFMGWLMGTAHFSSGEKFLIVVTEEHPVVIGDAQLRREHGHWLEMRSGRSGRVSFGVDGLTVGRCEVCDLDVVWQGSVRVNPDVAVSVRQSMQEPLVRPDFNYFRELYSRHLFVDRQSVSQR